MDLITLYNYQHIRNEGIGDLTFGNMVQNYNWTEDFRSSTSAIIMKKLFKLDDGQMFKVLLRFTLTNVYDKIYQLDQPIPFVIMRTEYTADNKGFKDVETIHGRKAKNVLGYLKAGVPVELFDLISNDLKEALLYK